MQSWLKQVKELDFSLKIKTYQTNSILFYGAIMTYENFDQLTSCLVLRRNLNKFIEEINRRPDLEGELMKGWDNNVKRFVAENRSKDLQSLNIYPKFTKKLQNKFSLSHDQAFELTNLLEVFAIGYLGYFQSQTLRPIIKQFHLECINLNERLGLLTDEIEKKMDGYGVVLDVLSCEELNGDEYSEALKSLINAHKKLNSLPDSISKSPLAKGVEFNKAARSTNWALFMWVEPLYVYWVNILGRTINNSNDGINGRKPLLEFLLFCIEPLHEAVEYGTLNNMLRKVQRDIKKRGGLRSPDFKIGSSSPFGVH